MRIEIRRPVKTLKILNEFEHTRKILNEFSCEENAINFLRNNRNNYSNKRKLDVILNNIEKNTLFLFSDSLKSDVFIFLENHNFERILKENEFYKLYLYFTGAIDKLRLENFLQRYSKRGFVPDFKGFIEKNLDILFTECNFPEYLLGEYPALKEIIFFLNGDVKIFKKLGKWQNNILSYLYSDTFSKDVLSKINFGIVHDLDKKLYSFFRMNKNVVIKNIHIKYIKNNGTLYKQYNLNLAQGDCISVYGKFIRNINRVRKEFYIGELFMFYSNKGLPEYKKEYLTKVPLNKINLINYLENRYKLNKIYCLFVKSTNILKNSWRILRNTIKK